MDCQSWEQDLSPHLQHKLLLLCEGDFRFACLAEAGLPAALAPGAGWGFVRISWPNSLCLPSFLICFINYQIQQAELRAPFCDKNKITA